MSTTAEPPRLIWIGDHTVPTRFFVQTERVREEGTWNYVDFPYESPTWGVDREAARVAKVETDFNGVGGKARARAAAQQIADHVWRTTNG